MVKLSHITFILCFFAGSFLSFAQKTEKSVEELINERDNILQLRNYTIALQYIKISEKRGLFIPLNMYSEELIDVYCRKNQELNDLKNTLGFAEMEMDKILMNDPAYNMIINEFNQLSASQKDAQRRKYDKLRDEAIKKLIENNPEYVQASDIRQKILSVINRKALSCIAAEFYQEKRYLSVDWIPPKHMDILMRNWTIRKYNRRYLEAEYRLKNTHKQ